MAKKHYWGRFKVGGKWDNIWHLIYKGVTSPRFPKDMHEARQWFMHNTRFTNKEVQITDKEPKHWAGRNILRR